MGLRTYGGSSADFITDPAGNWDGAGQFSVFTDEALTTQIDAQVTDKDGNPFPAGQPVAGAFGQVRFTVPDTYSDVLWVATFDPVAGTWRVPVAVWPADLPARLAAQEAIGGFGG